MNKKSEKPLKPVYLIYGKEPLLLDEALDRLRARFEKESPAGLDVRLFSGSSVDPQETLSALQTLPLMAERRLVIVKEAEKLTPTAEAALSGYVRNPSEAAVLVLVYSQVKKNKSLYKAISAKGGVFEYKAPGKGEYPQWIQNRFARHSKQTDYEAASLLLEGTGYDLRKLDNEIEKVTLFYDEQERISADDIAGVFSPGREGEVFEFVDVLGERKISQAIFLLRALLQRDEKGTGVFYPLLYHFRMLLKAKAYWEKGLRGAELFKVLRVSPYLVERCQAQMKNFSLGELKNIYLRLAEIDFGLKTDKQELDLALEILVSGMGKASEVASPNWQGGY